MASIPHVHRRRTRVRTVSESSVESTESGNSRPSSPTRHSVAKDTGLFGLNMDFLKGIGQGHNQGQSPPIQMSSSLPEFREAGLIGDAGLSGGARASSDDKITPSTTPSHTHDILTVSTDPNSASAATQDAAPSAADRNLYLDLHHPLLQLARSPRTIRRQISDPMVGCLGTRYLPVSPLATGDLPSGQELKFLVSPTKKSFEAPGSPIITTFAARQALFRPVSTHDSSLEDTMPLSSSLGNISSAVQLSGD